ncbi:MAG: hypothetical protein SF053_22270 [Bacteroidia bacterium]|nr:hypothetical protein [Bacteroidia bacterium]
MAPHKFLYEAPFENEIKAANKRLAKEAKQLPGSGFTNSPEFKELPENLQQVVISQIHFSRKIDFSKSVSFTAHEYLTYTLYEQFTNMLILLSDKNAANNPASLAEIAAEEHMQYVLNFSTIQIFERDGIGLASIYVQLYDNLTHDFLINAVYEGDGTNPGFEFACVDGSIDCMVNNALSKALKDVTYSVLSNSPSIKRKRELAQLRDTELKANYFSAYNDTAFLKDIIPQSDSSIVVSDQFQIVVDPAKSKFVAFFIKKGSASDFKSLVDKKQDNHVKIILEKNLQDETLLDEIPGLYAYIVKGVMYNGDWYYEKSNVTYFNAPSLEDGKLQYFYNLADWNFFKENSTEFNPEFWESGLFNKIKDLRQDPDWAIYGESSWESLEVNNRPYIGYYEIVADAIQAKLEEENEAFEDTLSKFLFIPFYEKNIAEHPEEFATYSTLNKELAFIYPMDKRAILNPVLITNGKGEKTIRYFLTFKGENTIYEWTYFTPTVLPEKTWHYGDVIVKQLNTLTSWNFAYNALDDTAFWEQYVFLKSGDNFKYLKKF